MEFTLSSYEFLLRSLSFFTIQANESSITESGGAFLLSIQFDILTNNFKQHTWVEGNGARALGGITSSRMGGGEFQPSALPKKATAAIGWVKTQ